jgi:hypothetical protein
MISFAVPNRVPLATTHASTQKNGHRRTPKHTERDEPVLEEYDLDTIRGCRPGDCGVRLPASSIARSEREVDWRAPDWRQQAGTLWRRVLADYTAGYLANGQSALAEYRNKEVPLSVAQEFDRLFEQSRVFEAWARGFFRDLRGFRRCRSPVSTTCSTGARATSGVRPVLAVTHLSLYRVPSVSPTERTSALIATKQIYATHYFGAALRLTLALDDGSAAFTWSASIAHARDRFRASCG